MTAAVRVPCLVCGRHRFWWATVLWYHQVWARPFPRSPLIVREPVLLSAPVCGWRCGIWAGRVLRGQVELSWAERARRREAWAQRTCPEKGDRADREQRSLTTAAPGDPREQMRGDAALGVSASRGPVAQGAP